MGLNELMSNGVKTKKIHVNDIRLNEYNKYPLSEIEELENSILEYGQLENGNAYEDLQADGKKYTLLSGHRRFTAIQNLYKKGLHDGMMDIRLEQKPTTFYKENKKMRHANSYRNLTPEQIREIRISDIKLAQEEFERRKDTPEEVKFNEECRTLSDWIGREIGISGRQVRTYMKQMKVDEVKIKEEKQFNETQIIKELKSIAKKIDKLNNLITENEIEIVFEGKNEKRSISSVLCKESSKFIFLADYIKNGKGE